MSPNFYFPEPPASPKVNPWAPIGVIFGTFLWIAFAWSTWAGVNYQLYRKGTASLREAQRKAYDRRHAFAFPVWIWFGSSTTTTAAVFMGQARQTFKSDIRYVGWRTTPRPDPAPRRRAATRGAGAAD